VQSLPLVISLLIAAGLVVPVCRSLVELGLTQKNYRGQPVAFPAGIAIVLAAFLSLVPLSLIQELAGSTVFKPGVETALIYVVGVAFLGLLDDLIGSGVLARGRRLAEEGAQAPAPLPRGWRGHASAVLSGRLSTGVLKALGSLGLALFVLRDSGRTKPEYLLAVALVVLTTNLFNLLDLRPGRSAKALVLLGTLLTVASTDVNPLWALGLFVGPIVALLPLDLRERGMLGDTGSNAIGAVAGLWLVLTLSTTAQAIALAIVLLITVYGEFRSISAFIDRTPGLRHLDSLGRISHA
jgi:UDP-N-acetylmuramyl pentapeptide phosphotransferase/UDP-N-acetylglucosamine-1-phosphate transferase